MPNLNQAPEIKFNGEKFKETPELKGKAIYSHLFMNALMNGLGERDCAALKIMLFLCGNAQGFKVAEKTICERCNISETGYRKARNKLVDLGWISYTPYKEIIVNYNTIYNTGTQCPSPLFSAPQEDYSVTVTEDYSVPRTTITQSIHNNITNSINNKIMNNCGSAAKPPKQVEERGEYPSIPESIANQAIGGYTYTDKEKGIIKINQTNKIYKIQKDSSFITNSEEILKKKEKI